ncbi:hypothetical protein FA95DRAFT_663086 [Auriscalpium vulgare]|uniref:Uncharacterized protein n=1 Tax=Auriscalpium vulgare TaxID=40419 RepID=A0ACB8S295_9AGAM|nr:hypothetical protein FA95DRAFT_663086 [Auriscalpium vulgare]
MRDLVGSGTKLFHRRVCQNTDSFHCHSCKYSELVTVRQVNDVGTTKNEVRRT